MHWQTRLNHPPKVQLGKDNEALVAPVYHSVKYSYPSIKTIREVFEGRESGFVYGRIGNPTVRALEELLAELQGTEDGICLASGVAAISTTLLSILSAGDTVLFFLESYRPTRNFIRNHLSRFGIKHVVLSVEDQTDFDAVMQKVKPRLVIFESPTNPVLKLNDIENIVKRSREVGSLVVMDNTFSGLHQHHDFDIDIYVHSLTKFACGHSDALGGAILGKKSVLDPIRRTSWDLGPSMDADVAFRMSRGLRTYALRMERQQENAFGLARWLEKRSDVRNLRYPGLSSHPQHQLALKQMGKEFGAVLAFDLVGDERCVETFCESLKLFKLTASLGSTESIVTPCMLFFGEGCTVEELKRAKIHETTVRLAVGVEEYEDLRVDLEKALQRINS